MLGILRKKKSSFPLTDLCSKVGLAAIEDLVERLDPSDELKRAKVLCYFIMYGAADFVNGSLDPEKGGLWEGSRALLANTNKDVLTAETIVWLSFLMGRLWSAERDSEMRERVGYLTLFHTNQFCLSFINETTGVDFRNRFGESRSLYLAAQKERGDLHEAFIGRLLACLGSRSLAEPLSTPPSLMLMPEGTPLALVVMIFFSTIPHGIYKSFTNLLRERSADFPWD